MPNRGPRKSLIERDRAWLLELCRERIGLFMSALDDREITIIRLRYGLSQSGHLFQPHTYGGVGRALFLSPERVRQIVNGALKKLREVESDACCHP